MKSYHPFVLFIAMLGFLPGYSLSTQIDETPISLFEFWDQQHLSEVELKIDLVELIEQKRSNNYLPATFSYRTADGNTESWDIEVRNRGRFRRLKCDFPPLKLRFPKKVLKKKGFKKFNDFKLVTRCFDDPAGRENLLREYLIYKMYSKLTDISFKVQLVKINYQCSRTGEEDNQYGILIEDSKELADRLKAEECEECYGIKPEEFNQANLQIHSLFQYMIGNTDWSVTMSRNLKIFRTEGDTPINFVAPYDFDFSGVVNATYAVPQASFGQTSVRHRVYLGEQWSTEQWAPTIGLFQSKEQELIDMINDFDLLNRKARRDIRKYLEEFYTQLDEGYIPIRE